MRAKKSLLKFKLKTEKFIKEQLWQLLLVVAFVALCAWIFEKPVEAVCFCIAHVIIRANFDKQYHSNVTRICLFITSLVVFFGILFCLPIKISLLSAIPIAFAIAFVGYLIAYKIEIEKEKAVPIKIPFNTNTCTEAELINRCALLHFSKKNTELAIEFFINKTPHKELADKYNVQEKSITTQKTRLKKKLNK